MMKTTTPSHRSTSSQSKVVLIKQKKTAAKKSLAARTKGRKSLPSFQIKALPRIDSERSGSQDHSPEVEFIEELPCDSMLAFQSLLANAEGLHIPLRNNDHFQVLLASQIFQRFEEHHVSTIWSELLSLIRSNQLLRLWCQDEGETVLAKTEDYMLAIKATCTDSASEQVVAWFLEYIKDWTEIAILEESLQDSWKEDITVKNEGDDQQSILSFQDALSMLLKLGFLLRATTASTSTARYHLWLPQWGLVLKHWNEARQKLLASISRSKEVSERNVLNQNRYTISTRFLIDELRYRGAIRIIQRPFGRFISIEQK